MGSKTAAALMLGLGLAACSSPEGGAAGGDGLTAAECRDFLVHTNELAGLDVARVLGEEQLQKDAQTCADYGTYSRRYYDCAMAADSVEALQGCGAADG